MIENLRNPIEYRVPTADTEIMRIWVGTETHPRLVRYANGNAGTGSGSAAPTTTAPAQLVVLTDSSGGTPSNTIADVPGSYTEATLANQIASLTAKVNALILLTRQHGWTTA